MYKCQDQRSNLVGQTRLQLFISQIRIKEKCFVSALSTADCDILLFQNLCARHSSHLRTQYSGTFVKSRFWLSAKLERLEMQCQKAPFCLVSSQHTVQQSYHISTVSQSVCATQYPSPHTVQRTLGKS